MKNKLLPLFIILGTYTMHSQVGIGTKDPHKSSQLEVSASDKGVLIPNVALTSLTDAVTIKDAKESLLVFNTTANTDIIPGYYYWFDNRWNRLALSTEISGAGTVIYNPTTKELTYIDSSGNTQIININDLETITTLTDNNDGTYTYVNEKKVAVKIDVVGDVTTNFSTIANSTEVKQIIENIVNNTAGNVSYDSTKNEFTYLDQSGATQVININDMVKNNETVTTLSDNNDGTYTYTNEDGIAVTINVVGDVTSNFSTIANNTTVKEIIENIVNNTTGNVSYDSTKNEFTYLDQSGATQVINIIDSQGVFLKMFKRRFKEEFDFIEDSFFDEVPASKFDRIVFVIYNHSELLRFLSQEKRGSNILVCLFNEQFYRSLSFLEVTKNLILFDESKTRMEILKELKTFFSSKIDSQAEQKPFKLPKKYQKISQEYYKAMYFLM